MKKLLYFFAVAIALWLVSCDSSVIVPELGNKDFAIEKEDSQILEYTQAQMDHIDSVANLIKSYGYFPCCDTIGIERYRQLDHYLLMPLDEWKEYLENFSNDEINVGGRSRTNFRYMEYDGMGQLQTEGWISDYYAAIASVMLHPFYWPTCFVRVNFIRIIGPGDVEITSASGLSRPVSFNGAHGELKIEITVVSNGATSNLLAILYVNRGYHGYIESAGIY